MSSLLRTYMVRVSKEVQKLQTDLPPEITCWPEDENKLDKFRAVMKGPLDSPYSGGIFILSLSLPSRYPHEPPKANFVTRIYHPNIDQNGRICHNILKIPPTGTWTSGFNLITVIMAIYSLLSNPNPDDPLDAEVATQFKNDRILFNQTAELLTKKYATGSDSSEEKSTESFNKNPADSGALVEENSQKLTKSDNNNKTHEPKAPTRPQSGKRSFNLRKASAKEKSGPFLGDSKTTEKNIMGKRLMQTKVADSETILLKTPAETKDLEKDCAEKPSQHEDFTIDSSAKVTSPILEPDLSIPPEKLPTKSMVSSTGKKEGKKTLANVSSSQMPITPKVTFKPSFLKKRAAEQTESSKLLVQNPKKRVLFKKAPQTPREERSTKDTLDLKKKSAFGEKSVSSDGGEIELDLALKTNGLVAKLTLSQAEDTPAPRTPKNKSMSLKANTSGTRVSQDHSQPLAPSPEKTTKSDGPLVIEKSSYFSSRPCDAFPILESESTIELPPIKPKPCSLNHSMIALEMPSSECEKLSRTDSFDSQGERKRGWRPSPLRESVSVANLAKSKEARRPTFSLKKLRKSNH